MNPQRHVSWLRNIIRPAAVVAAISLLGVTLAACGNGDDNIQVADDADRIPVKIAHQSAGSLSFLAIRVAHDKGFFTDEGIDPEVITIGDPGVIGAALENRSVDVAADDNSVHAANFDRGINLRVFAGLYQGLRLQLVVRKGLDIPKMGDPGIEWKDVMAAMKGRVVATPGVAVSGGRIFEMLAGESGLKSGDYTLIETAAGAPLVGAIESGRADAFLHADATTITAVNSGVGEVALDLADDIPEYFANLQYVGFAALETTLKKYPQLQARWQRATQRAVDLINDPANSEYLHDVALRSVNNMAATKDSPELDATIRKLAPGYISEVDPAAFDTTLDFWRQIGLLKSDVTGQELLWQAPSQ
ncbi:ABC-type nitrate/sulfonate/bicarbonate transport system substrate-binding protein [Rhodococcus sp. 27YEA15]|uniref:ABC transporter substrate-binding protein n=1 Tax=Rhodococcus sp. 27YEA15 TaxID=3156259 RepID=UPI003C7A80E7